MMQDKMKLTIEIKNKHPVELLDLARSMMALGDEYQRFLVKHDAMLDADKVKLYIKEIRSGSIITELVALAPYTLPFVEHADSVLEYAKYLKAFYDWSIGRNDQPMPQVEKTTLQNMNQIIEPIAKDKASQINFGAINVSGDFILNLSLSGIEANAAQNAIRREIESRKEPITGIREQVVMYWAQARNEQNNKAGDKARIESICPNDVKVRFANDELKTRMLYDEPHPFNKSFLVDVAVETINDKPVLYKVLTIHEVFDR